MEIVGPSSSDDMVAEFLRGEIDSSRLQADCWRAMDLHGLTEERVRNPNLADEGQNRRRADVLGAYRGWNRNVGLFTGFPRQLEWSRLRLNPGELREVRYTYRSWIELARGTYRAEIAAERIMANDPTIKMPYAARLKRESDSHRSSPSVRQSRSFFPSSRVHLGSPQWQLWAFLKTWNSSLERLP